MRDRQIKLLAGEIRLVASSSSKMIVRLMQCKLEAKVATRPIRTERTTRRVILPTVNLRGKIMATKMVITTMVAIMATVPVPMVTEMGMEMEMAQEETMAIKVGTTSR